jgi:hypothetical protein
MSKSHLDSYGGYEDRGGLIDAVIERVEISRSGIEERFAGGRLPYVALKNEGNTRGMESLIRHLEQNGRNLQAAIE